MSEGMFQKYWSKPTKKKGVTYEEPGNPPKDSMSKVGPCQLIIEPHIFEVIMWTVKDNSARQPFQPPPPPMYRPIIQYGPPNGVMPPPAPPPVQAVPINPIPSPMRAQEPPRLNGTHTPLTPSHAPAPLQNGNHLPPRQSPVPHIQHPYQASAPAPPPQQAHVPPPPPQAAPPSKQSDPVIQMLAERAATDAKLKALMRIVADGKASPEELKSFQGHIDELTKLLQSRNAAAAAAAAAKPPQPPPQIVRPPPPPPPQVQPPRPPPVQQPPPPMQSYYSQPAPQPQSLRSRGPPPPARSEISAVVFEFVGGSGDRFLFPKHSILDYGMGHSVVCSFLIIRRGTPSDKPYDRAIDYYQPVTIRVESKEGGPRTLENLHKVVAPQDEVRRYMNDIMDGMTRAEYVLLAMQLPQEGADPAQLGNGQDDDTIMKDSPAPAPMGENNGVLWTSTITGEPNKQPSKAAKQPPTESEVYQSFIATVT